MRFIRKRPEPKALVDWKKANAELPDASSFTALPAEIKDILRDALGREQGFLCAYVMTRLESEQGCHIEHVLPQSKHPDQAVDYSNLVLCAPEKGPCEYGAIAKADVDVDAKTFVSPLHASCEARFRYRLSGEVRPASEADEAAKKTIALLALNHRILVNARRDAILQQGILEPRERRGAKPITAARARRLVEAIMQPDGLGRLAPYCLAISHAAETFAREVEQRGRRKLQGDR